MTTTLDTAMSEIDWRERTLLAMRKRLPDASAKDWQWIVENFSIDVKSLRHRARYITVLAAVVFFLIFQGFDLLEMASDPESRWDSVTFGSLVVAFFDKFSQLVSLVFLFLLVHLSAGQVHAVMVRYLDCARLILGDSERVK